MDPRDDDDDWAPLPEAVCGTHPGEDIELAPVPKAPVVDEPAEAARSVGEQRVLADEARAEAAALAQLQRRLAAAPKKGSLVDAYAMRADRDRRRRRAANAPDLAATSVRSDLTGADVPLEVRYTAGKASRDPREDEVWYCELPRAEQDHLREKWAAEREQRRPVGSIKLDRMLAAAASGGGLAGFAGLLGTPMGVTAGHVGALIVVGAIAATFAHVTRGGRHGWALAGMVTFGAVLGPFVFAVPFVIYVAMLLAYGFGALGMGEEMRASGGFDARRRWFPFGAPARLRGSLSESAAAPSVAHPPAERVADPRPADRRA